MRTSFPFSDNVVQSRIWIERPGLRQTESPYTGYRYEMDYGGARWAGTTTIGVMKGNDGSDGEEMEAWIAEWIAGQDPGEIPLYRPIIGFTANTTVTGWSDGKVSLSADLAGPKATGSMIRLGNRTYMCTGHSGDEDEFWAAPEVDPGTGVAVGTGKFIRARPRGRIEMARTSSFYGPWTLPWIEIPA